MERVTSEGLAGQAEVGGGIGGFFPDGLLEKLGLRLLKEHAYPLAYGSGGGSRADPVAKQLQAPLLGSEQQVEVL